MDETSALLEKRSNSRERITTRTFVLIYALIYGFALQISSRAQPQYVYYYLKQHSGGNITNNKTENVSKHICSAVSNEDKFQEEAASWTWYFKLSEYGLSIPVIMLVGPLTDRIGRKPILIWNGLLVFLSYAFRTVVVFFDLNLYYFVIAVMINGFSGTFYTFNFTNYALMSDVTTENKQRSFLMAVFDALLGLGITCSQITTGYLIELTSFTYPFLMTTGVLLVYVIFLYITLKDPWKYPEQNTKLSIGSLIPQIFSLFSKEQRKKSSFNNFLLLVIVFIFYYFPFDSFVSNRTLYQLGPPFCWTSEHIGWYGAGEDIELFIIATAILKIAHMFTNDANMALVGLVSSAACFGLFGLTNSDWMIYGVTAVGLFRILPIPLLKAMMSRIVQPDQQGVLFSNISVITALCAVVGSTVFNNIYYETRPIYKGLVFMVMAGSQLIGTILMIFTICRKSSKHQKDLATKEPEIQATDQ